MLNQVLVLLRRGMEVVERFRTATENIPEAAMIAFGILAVFGILNCLFGYRLMRFWMMLIGFVLGASLCFAGAWYIGVPFSEKRTYLIAMLVAGVLVAIVTFAVYRAGIFLMVAALGIILSIYLVHPNSSATFFLCLLIGIALGIGAMRFDRQVIIVTTSLFGGALGGYSLARLLRLEELPYGVGLSAGLAILGMLIQFLFNRPKGQEEPLDEEDSEELSEQEDPVERELSQNEFYEQYFHGGDVFDRTAKETQTEEED